MKYAMVWACLGLVLVGCGDDTTGDDTSVASSGSSGGSASGSAGSTSTGIDDATSGSASGGGSTSAMGSTGAVDSSGGTSVAETGNAGTFPCGDRLECSVATQYCQQTVGGAVGSSPSYVCMELPEGCMAGSSCDCLDAVQCADICEMVGDGAQVTCQAP